MGVFQYLSFLQSRQTMLEPVFERGRPLQATIDPVFPDSVAIYIFSQCLEDQITDFSDLFASLRPLRVASLTSPIVIQFIVVNYSRI